MKRLIETKCSLRCINTILVLIYSMFFILSAQTPIYETIDISHGLPTNYVYRVLETQDGYIWICTERGICRYDGIELICYNSMNGLPDNDYYLAYEDPIGRLWINGLSQTLSCFYNDSIYNVHFSNNDFIQRIAVNDSMIYFHDDDNVIAIDSNLNAEIFEFSEVGNHDTALNGYLSKLCDPMFTISESQDLVTNSIVGRIHETYATSFCYYDSLQKKRVFKRYPQINPGFHSILQHSYVDDKIQIYENNHLVTTDTQLSKFDTILIEPEDDIFTNSAYIDSRENLWICTKKGILIQHKTQRDLDLLEHEETKNQNITHLINYNDGYVFANELEQLFSYKDDVVENIFSEALSSRNIFYSVEVFNSEIFFSNGSNGLRSLNSKSELTSYLDGEDLDINRGWPILKAKQFDLNSNFAFTLSRGLHILDKEKRQFKKLKHGIYTELVYSELDSMIWTCDKDFLYGYKFIEENFNVELMFKHELRNIERLFLLDNGSLLVSSFSGANFMCQGENCLQEKSFEGEKIIACKKYDEKYYVGTQNGLYEIINNDFDSRNKVFDFRTLGPNRIVNDFILYKGRFIFATNEGIVSAKKMDKIIEDDFYNIPFYLDSINGKRPKEILKDSMVCLPYLNRNFSLKYHSNIYSKIKDYKYEYQLMGIDQNAMTTQRRELYYSNLNPGNYTLKVKALDIHGNDSAYKFIRIKVEYPWWLKWYSLIVWVALFIGLVYLIRSYLSKSVDNQISYTKKLAELELNALQSQMNPHFVFNALNSIQNLVISNKNDLADKYLSRFSQLMRLFLESSKHKFISLSEELLIINRYLEIEKLRFGDKLNYNIINELTDLDQKVLVPATILQPFVENALVHGLFHKSGPGQLDIIIRSEHNLILIIITDDGVGRAYANNVNMKKLYKSRGMEIINDKLNLLKKIEDVDISYSIRDLNNFGENGTEVIIKIVNK